LQNRRANAPLFEAIGVDFGMVPAEVIAHEVLARLATPVLMRFLPQVPRQGEEWSARMVDRLVEVCGRGTPDLWHVVLDADEAPALLPHLHAGDVRLDVLLRHTTDRDRALRIVPLAMLRSGERTMAPDGETVLRPGDQLLLAGRLQDRAALESTMTQPPVATYVVEGRQVPASWVLRRFAGAQGRD
jgi:voltage-gated potassium channel